MEEEGHGLEVWNAGAGERFHPPNEKVDDEGFTGLFTPSGLPWATVRAPLCFSAFSAFGLALALAAPVRADPVQRHVRLRDGTELQGELVEDVPGERLVLKLATGEVRTIPAGEIEDEPRPMRNPITVTTKKTWTPPPTLPAAPPFRGPDAARIHLEADHPWGMYLFSEAPNGAGWDRLCEAPCDLRVDPAKTYRIDGPMVLPTTPFKVEPRRDQTLYVKSGNVGGYAAGWVLLVTGIAMALPGAYIASRGIDVTDKSTGKTQHTTTPGWILLGVGVAMAIPGVALVAANGSTEVNDDRGKRLAFRVSATRAF